MDGYLILIPTMSLARTFLMLRQIESNTSYPSKVMIIDNDNFFNGELNGYSYPIEIISFKENIGVNAAWNYGLLSFPKNWIISFLNDDIIFGKNFIFNIQEAFKNDKELNVLCPNNSNVIGNSRFVTMGKREGWAFTFSYEFAAKLPLIPKELFIFCGDDWFWYWSNYYGYNWIKDIENIIVHEVGLTMKENPKLRQLLKNEKRILLKKIKEYMDYEDFISVCKRKEDRFKPLPDRRLSLSFYETFKKRHYFYSPNGI